MSIEDYPCFVIAQAVIQREFSDLLEKEVLEGSAKCASYDVSMASHAGRFGIEFTTAGSMTAVDCTAYCEFDHEHIQTRSPELATLTAIASIKRWLNTLE